MQNTLDQLNAMNRGMPLEKSTLYLINLIRTHLRSVLVLEGKTLGHTLEAYYTYRNAALSLIILNKLFSILDDFYIESLIKHSLSDLLYDKRLLDIVLDGSRRAIIVLEDLSDILPASYYSIKRAPIYFSPFNFTAIGHFCYLLIALHHINMVHGGIGTDNHIFIDCPDQFCVSPVLLDVISNSFDNITRVNAIAIKSIPLDVVLEILESKNLWSVTKYANGFRYHAGLLDTCLLSYRGSIGDRVRAKFLQIHGDQSNLIYTLFKGKGIERPKSLKFCVLHGRDHVYHDDLKSNHSCYFRNVDFKAYEHIINNNDDILFVSLGVNNWNYKHRRLFHLSEIENLYFREILQTYLITSCDFAVGCSSGPSHLLSLFGIPTLFTNTVWDDIPLLAGPYGITLFKSGIKNSLFTPNLAFYAASVIHPNYYPKLTQEFDYLHSIYYSQHARFRYFFNSSDELLPAFLFLKNRQINKKTGRFSLTSNINNTMGLEYAKKYKLPASPIIFNPYS